MRFSRQRLSPTTVIKKRAYWQYIKTLFGSSLVGYWPLYDVSTPAIDLSSNGLSGVCSNVTFLQSGFGDGKTSSSFNGTTSFINVYSSALNTLMNKHEGTFAAWVKVTNSNVWSDSAYRNILRLQTDANNRVTIYKDGAANNQLVFNYVAGGTNKSVTIPSISYTTWFHLAVTWSKSLNIMRVYLNGIPSIIETFGITGTWSGDLGPTTCCIGSANTTPASVWSGNIQHAVLCNQSMSPYKIYDLVSLTRKVPFSYAYKAPAALTTPTYDGSNQSVHPDVYDAGAGNTWNGKRYWMVMTPYPAADATKENPSILVTDDGTTWTVPVGLTNPIEADPGGGNYNADPDLIISTDNIAYVFFKQSGKLWRKSSPDGVTWSAKADVGIDGAISPALAYDGTLYHLWYMNTASTPYKLYHVTSNTLNGVWSAGTLCTLINIPSGKDLWHINMNYNNGIWDSLFTVCTTNTSGAGTTLYFAKSSNGLIWTFDNLPLLNIGFGWDLNPYRACMIKNTLGYDMWYSAQGASNTWRIGRTQVYVP